MKCPFCAEEIKDEAIVCKHCHTNLAEEHARALTETVTMAETVSECEHVCKGLNTHIGFSWFFVICWAAFGMWLGASNILEIRYAIHQGQQPPDYVFNTQEILTKHTLLYMGICAYIGWSMFWGSIMVRPIVRRFMSSLFVFGNGLINLLLRIIGIWLFSELVLVPVIGTLVGGLGGSLYMYAKHKGLNTEYKRQVERTKKAQQVAGAAL